MVQKIFGLDDVSSEFAQAIYTRTEGNPFFVEELLKALVKSGGLFYREGSWNRTALEELNLPRSVREAILRHLDGLTMRELQVISTAAVIGRRFDFDLLQAVTGLSEGEILSDLRTLINQQLISIQQHSNGDTSGDYQFRHALTRDAIYGRLLPQERILLHRRVAETIESLAATSPAHLSAASAQALDSLALHYRLAEVWGKALEYSERAGEQAQALYASQAAIAHFTRALEAAEHLCYDSSHQAVSFARASARAIGGIRSGTCRPASRIATGARGRRRNRGVAAPDGPRILWVGREYAKAGEYFERALAQARRMGDPHKIALTLNRVGNWQVNTGRARRGVGGSPRGSCDLRRRAGRAGYGRNTGLAGHGQWPLWRYGKRGTLPRVRHRALQKTGRHEDAYLQSYIVHLLFQPQLARHDR